MVKRKKKTDLQKAKEILWNLCKKIIFEKHNKNGQVYCYTCGAGPLEGSNKQLGHFIPSSVCSTELKYSLENLKFQCFSCNIWKSGNWVAYEKHLIQDNGENFIKELKARNEKTKGLMYRLDWYEVRIFYYQKIVDNFIEKVS